jgi:outer membrane protein
MACARTPQTPRRPWRVAAPLLLSATATAAQAATSLEPIAQIEDGVNFVGAVAGRVPEFWGSRDSATGIAPMARWQLGGERFVQWLGTEVTINLLDHPRWRAGPSLGVRLGRREVSDPVVRAMRPVASTGELGAFLGYTEPLGSDPRHRWGFNVALAGATGSVYSGLYGVASAHWLKPIAPWLTLSATAGLGFAGRGFQRAYFGVDAADAALFPGLAAGGYRPGSGLTDVRAVAGAMVHLSLNWHVLAGVRWQRLLSDVADSPIVRQRGDATQWIAGAGVVYMWR